MITFKNKMGRLVVLSFIVGASLFSVVAASGPFDDFAKRRKERREGIINDIVKQLELTSNQKREIKRQREGYKEKVAKTREELWINIKKLRQGLEDQESDVKAVYDIADKVKDLRETLFYERIDSVLAIKKILTPAQYEKLQRLKKERVKSIKEKLKSKIGDGKRLEEILGE